MNSIVSKLPEGARVVNWEYKVPLHNMSPTEAFKIARNIRNDFLLLLENGLSENEAQKKLLTNQDVLLFSSEQCFPSLFKICTSKNTTDDDFEAVYNLVLLRKQVDLGLMSEEDGNTNALHIAAKAKEKR